MIKYNEITGTFDFEADEGSSEDYILLVKASEQLRIPIEEICVITSGDDRVYACTRKAFFGNKQVIDWIEIAKTA